jgi:hypothetical protein
MTVPELEAAARGSALLAQPYIIEVRYDSYEFCADLAALRVRPEARHFLRRPRS